MWRPGPPSRKSQVSTTGGAYPLWRPDGKEAVRPEPRRRDDGGAGDHRRIEARPGAPTVLFPTRIFGGGAEAQQGRQYDVAPDGRLLINTVLDRPVGADQRC